MSEYIMECNKGTDVTLFKERIVRCRDCSKFTPDKRSTGWCKEFAANGKKAAVNPNGFCAWGERRDA